MNPVSQERTERGLHQAFILSVIGKGFFALLETVLGAMLLFTNSIVELVLQLVRDELIEDPSAIHESWVQPLLQPTHEAQVFGGFYLLSHGVIKIFLVAGLLRKRLWAYPASIAVFALFIVYQLFRYFAKTHSVWLLVITAGDIIVLWLIYHEYRRALARGATIQ